MRRPADAVRLSQLSRYLHADDWEAPDYRVLWQAALNDVIPAVQVNDRWHFNPRDVPAIAAALGLRKRTSPASRQPLAA